MKKKLSFIHRKAYLKGMTELFSFIQAPPDIQTAIASSLLVRNGITLLNATYGTGKTQLVNLIKKIFFGDDKGDFDFDYESCHQDLTAFDVLYHLDLAELQKGKEVVHPKKMITAKFKFLNEIQRANPAFYNSMLPLLSERQVTYRDEVFYSPDFIMYMDQNPQDAASSEIPRAFYDRIDYVINLSTIDILSSIQLFDKRQLDNGIEWDSLENLVKPVMKSYSFDLIWQDVVKIAINKNELLFANFLIYSFMVCTKANRSITNKKFRLDCDSCKFKGEVCSHITLIPGQRALNSMLRMSQARAWLAGRDAITIDDLVFSLPHVLGHRLLIKAQELASSENTFLWIQDIALKEILSNKFKSWNKAVKYYLDNKNEKLEAIVKEDLVLKQIMR